VLPDVILGPSSIEDAGIDVELIGRLGRMATSIRGNSCNSSSSSSITAGRIEGRLAFTPLGFELKFAEFDDDRGGT
jgi:hypothetical protein